MAHKQWLAVLALVATSHANLAASIGEWRAINKLAHDSTAVA
jgi:hypothetical protein